MQKYKHKITGDIVELSGNGYRLSPGLIIPKPFIEQGNDWEEIVEKDYVILLWSDRNNPYSHSLRKANEDFIIHSVKRLSDEKIFTIGDNTTIGVIKEIKLQLGCTCEIAVRGTTNSCSLTFISTYGKDKGKLKLQKVKQKLFITKDGVDIFKGDTYYFIGHEELGLFLLEFMSNSSNDSDLYTRHTTFYDRDKAIEYIVLNKPCLSMKDLLNANVSQLFTSNPDYLLKLRRTDLESIIKTKLNL